MDLRNQRFSEDDFAQLLQFVVQRKLGYQPFRFDDDHEVGEGMALLAGTSPGRRKGVLRWPLLPDEIADLAVQPDDLQAFRSSNDALRSVYDHFVSFICETIGSEISALEFAEFGCNSGYFLFSLLRRGALSAVGLDFTYNQLVFDFFNRKLGTQANFLFSEWDSFAHQPNHNAVPEVDVCLSIAVLCHLADPLHHLTYLCSRARRAVFVWTPSFPTDDLIMGFGQPAGFSNSLAWPLSFDNLVKPSRGLIELCLKESGFGDIHHINPIPTEFDAIDFWNVHTGIIAFRTSNARTVYSGGATTRVIPWDVPIELLAEEIPAAAQRVKRVWRSQPHLVDTIGGYNIVRLGNEWYAVPQGVPADFERDDPASIPGLIQGMTRDEVTQMVTRA